MGTYWSEELLYCHYEVKPEIAVQNFPEKASEQIQNCSDILKYGPLNILL